MSANLGLIKLPEAIENRVLSFLIPENPNSIKDWTLSSIQDFLRLLQTSRRFNGALVQLVRAETRELITSIVMVKRKISLWRKRHADQRETKKKVELLNIKSTLDGCFNITDGILALFITLPNQSERNTTWAAAIYFISLLSTLGTVYVPLRTKWKFIKSLPDRYLRIAQGQTNLLTISPLKNILGEEEKSLGLGIGLLNNSSLELMDSLDEAGESAIKAWRNQKISGPLEKYKLWTSVSLLGIGISLIYLGRFNPDSPGWENLIEMILGTLILACYPKYNLLKILWKLTDQPLSPLPLRDFVLPPERAPELSAFFESKGLNLDSLPPPGFALAFAPQEQAPIQAPIEVVVDENTPLLTGHGTT